MLVTRFIHHFFVHPSIQLGAHKREQIEEIPRHRLRRFVRELSPEEREELGSDILRGHVQAPKRMHWWGIEDGRR